MAEAIGRLAGPGALEGESPIARSQQAEVEIELSGYGGIWQTPREGYASCCSAR